MTHRHQSILATIGNTPCVRLNHLAPKGVNLYAKLEAFNPMGSVKDRFALEVIERAERSGALAPGQTVIEATSGNTGIGLAMVCAQKGYPLVIVMAENFSVERRKLLRFLGARVVLTPAAARGTGMIAKARELAAEHDWFLARQFDNDANADVHSLTTAREILRDFAGERLDAFVTGYGTGGTLKGVARVLRAQRPETRIVACEPDNSPLLASGIAQPYGDDGERSSHPSARPHPVQGWGPDFIPRFAEDALVSACIDEILPVNGAAALDAARNVAAREGVFCGISGGATIAAALEICQRMPRGANVLCMVPDTGERYMSTVLFDGVDAEMDERERDIAASTPSCRLDAPSPSPGPAPSPKSRPAPSPNLVPPPERDVQAEAHVDAALADRAQPVTMFALEWCEFCWSVRKLLTAAGIPYRSIDLDSVAYQKDDLGGRMRKVLRARTGVSTIPLVFVGETFVGGCTETLDAYATGQLQALLAETGFEAPQVPGLDAHTLLPGWIARRGAA